tara:strand:- start:4483 stop:4716 length:234 start_codon:yes stop_codon:yes gene_type:complete
MNLNKYIQIKNLKDKLNYILYHNNILINSIYHNIDISDSIDTKTQLLKEINEINFENIKMKEILFDIKCINCISIEL